MISVEDFAKSNPPIDIDSFSWESVSGEDALILIERHGKNSTHSGQLMEKWLAANKQKKYSGNSWHIDGCDGSCLACLIEGLVKVNYGTLGLEFLLSKVSPSADIESIPKSPEEIRAFVGRHMAGLKFGVEGGEPTKWMPAPSDPAV